MPKNYWMVVASPESFRTTRQLGFTLQGLQAQHQRKLQRIEPGDRILYYIGGDRYFAATATVTSRYFQDHNPEHKMRGGRDWTFKVRIQPEVILDDRDYIDARQLAPRLDYVRKWPPESWYMAFAASKLHLLPKRDFMLVEAEMRKLKSANSQAHSNVDRVDGHLEVRAEEMRPEQEEAASEQAQG